MAISEEYAGQKAGLVSGDTEWSLSGNDTSVDTITTDGVYQCFIDVSDMVTGDELAIRVYEKVQSSGTQRLVYQANLFGPQSPPVFVMPSLVLMHGWDMTIEAVAGTITIDWSIRKVA